MKITLELMFFNQALATLCSFETASLCVSGALSIEVEMLSHASSFSGSFLTSTLIYERMAVVFDRSCVKIDEQRGGHDMLHPVGIMPSWLARTPLQLD